jgi:hypothetical protein
MMEGQNEMVSEPERSGWRFRAGIVVLVVGWLCPLLVPVVVATDLPTEWKTVLSGLLMVGIPEVFTVAAVAILGKSGFNLIKERFFGFLKRHGPADEVSRTRYRIGLVMFVVPILFGWLAPYGPDLMMGQEVQNLWVNIMGDLMFVASFFVLGGDFWDKLRALFIQGAKAQFPVRA